MKGGLDVGLAIVNNLAHKSIWQICGNSTNHTYDNSFNIYIMFSYLVIWPHGIISQVDFFHQIKQNTFQSFYSFELGQVHGIID